MSSYIIKKLYSNFRSVDLNLIFLIRLTANSAELALVMVLPISLFNKTPEKLIFLGLRSKTAAGLKKVDTFG